MIYELVVPLTIEDNRAVRVLEWHVAPGQAVARGALIVEVETHKALIEIRAGQGGTLRRQLCGEGEWCPLGSRLALLSDAPNEPLEPVAAAMAAEFVIG